MSWWAPFKSLKAADKAARKRLPPIRIAGIYTICGKLGLPKYADPAAAARQIVVAMTSGRDAIYRWDHSGDTTNVDWAWHVFRFDRYVRDGEDIAALRRYS